MSQVVIVTGAASGLGWALAQVFLKAGHSVLLADRDEPLLQQRMQSISHPSQAASCVCDVTLMVDRQRLLEVVEQRFGRLDVLINNAGITHRSPAAHTGLSVLEKVMVVDWQAPMALALAALPLLTQSRGQIINIGSMAGWMPVPGRAAYCAAKAALSQFFEVLRLEVEADGIHVLMVYPSFLDTPIERNALGHDGAAANHARSTVGNVRSPEWMANIILQASHKRQHRVFPDRLSAFASLLWRLWPALYMRLIKRKFSIELQR
ncbi:MAG: short chain dehydrogenase [Gammaproteobacteria bacterium HGW-Gammaproteobacteria-14]|nr:MAG: short chain dehydrogenase [Gammaproteobacteria bacterium HGW-Gammaproteobacteria-14]